MKCFKTSISAVIEAFRPYIILSVHGVDLHYLDPLTHMSCTLESLYQIPYMIQQLAERYTDGKVLMFGGGGYNIWDVVPRAWAHVYLALQGQPIQHGPFPMPGLTSGSLIVQNRFRLHGQMSVKLSKCTTCKGN